MGSSTQKRGASYRRASACELAECGGGWCPEQMKVVRGLVRTSLSTCGVDCSHQTQARDKHGEGAVGGQRREAGIDPQAGVGCARIAVRACPSGNGG